MWQASKNIHSCQRSKTMRMLLIIISILPTPFQYSSWAAIHVHEIISSPDNMKIGWSISCTSIKTHFIFKSVIVSIKDKILHFYIKYYTFHANSLFSGLVKSWLNPLFFVYSYFVIHIVIWVTSVVLEEWIIASKLRTGPWTIKYHTRPWTNQNKTLCAKSTLTKSQQSANSAPNSQTSLYKKRQCYCLPHSCTSKLLTAWHLPLGGIISSKFHIKVIVEL